MFLSDKTDLQVGRKTKLKIVTEHLIIIAELGIEEIQNDKMIKHYLTLNLKSILVICTLRHYLKELIQGKNIRH